VLQSTAKMQRTQETLYFNGEDFFDDLLDSLHHTQKTIHIEMYIFALDELGHRFIANLVNAVERGVKVQLLIDGVGSSHWSKTLRQDLRNKGIELKVYHPLPWSWEQFFPHFFHRLKNMNSRNHRKVIILDEKEAWLGSRNISHVHIDKKAPWRDTSIMIRGGEVSKLLHAFQRAWEPARKRISLKRPRFPFYKLRDSSIRLNDNIRLRRFFYKDLLYRMKTAKNNISITNPYIILNRGLLNALLIAAKNKTPINIIIPLRSDVIFYPLITLMLFEKLLKAGVRIYQYSPTLLHAKTLLIDDFAMVGSSNLNSRSLIHDLEVDVKILDPKNKKLLASQFEEDLKHSQEVTLDSFSKKTVFQKIFGPLVFLIRYWL